MKAKYYIDADQAEAHGSCRVPREQLGDRKLPITTAAVGAVLRSRGVLANYLYWPAWKLQCLDAVSNETVNRAKEIERRLDELGFLFALPDAACDCPGCESGRNFNVRSPEAKAAITEAVGLLNEVGDLFHKEVRENAA